MMPSPPEKTCLEFQPVPTLRPSFDTHLKVPSTRPSWNGWGPTLANSHFQPAKAAGLTAADVPKLTLSEKTMDAYRQTRSSSVDFYQTAMDGQLKLFFFDNRDSITALIDKAVHAAKAK